MDEVLKRIVDLIGPRHGASKSLADYLGIHPNVITNWKNGRNKSYRGYLPQIADYFGVSVDYLLGNEPKEKAPAKSEGISDDDIKFALFNGADGITDEMFEEVKRFAQFIQERERNKPD